MPSLVGSEMCIRDRKKGEEGVKETNKCNVEWMNTLMPDIDPKQKKVAKFADEEMLKICPNNRFSCCTVEEMAPMLYTFKFTRELLLFKNLMLEKLLLYFNSVAKESFEKFLKTFTEEQIQCTGQTEYSRLKMYYSFIQENSETVLDMVKKTTNQIINVYSSFICTTCSPVNMLIYEFNDNLNKPVISINKRTCQNVIEFSLERKNLAFIWNRLNKIINSIKCKTNTKISKKDVFKSKNQIDLEYYMHEECLSEDQSFVDNIDCANLCREELTLFTLDDFRLYRVNFAIKALQEMFELQISKKNIDITKKLMESEEQKHPNAEVKNHIEKKDTMTDKYFFLKQKIDSRYNIKDIEINIEKYSGLISNSYELNISYLNSQKLFACLSILLISIRALGL